MLSLSLMGEGRGEGAIPRQRRVTTLLHPKYLHHLVAQVVDYLDGDAA